MHLQAHSLSQLNSIVISCLHAPARHLDSFLAQKFAEAEKKFCALMQQLRGRSEGSGYRGRHAPWPGGPAIGMLARAFVKPGFP
jgi:hypothetical protein